MSAYPIPFSRPPIVGKEEEYISAALRSGVIGGDGPFTKRCEEFIQQALGGETALLTTSCTSALEMAATLCEIDEGDEVIMPSFTFPSTATAFSRRGARIVFADIREDTLNIDEQLVSELLTPHTKAIVPVHYAGVPCEMDAILTVAQDAGTYIIEDAAQAYGASYKGTSAGTLGHLGTISFHHTKNLGCGEGGALLVNADQFAERAEIIREKGTNRARFLRGEVDKYTWVDTGSSYLPSDILAAFLLAQLETYALIAERRKSLYQFYEQSLGVLEEQGNATISKVPQNVVSSHHIFFILVDSEERREALRGHLAEAGIQATSHYVPLHTSPYGSRVSKTTSLPVTDKVAGCILRLPLHHDLSRDDQSLVVDTILSFYKSS